MTTIKDIRTIQKTGTSHDVIEALITYLESKDVSVASKVATAVKKVAKKTTK